MNIQEFSHRLGRDEHPSGPSHPSHPSHPSQLFRALRELRSLDVDRLRRPMDWGVWNDQEPRVRAAK